MGKLTIMCGDPGLGKSFMTLDILSRLTRGVPMPGEDFSGTPESPAREIGAGILLSAEDDPADTLRPRLEAMGADLELCFVLDGIEHSDGSVDNFDINRNIEHLRSLVEQKGNIRLIVVDPVSAYVGQTDSYNNAQVRSMLKPLSDLAADTGVAVILVTHLRKAQAAKAVHQAMGSLAFTAAARTVLVVTKDRDDPDLRVVLVAKSNLGKDRVGWSYKIQDGTVAWQQAIEAGADEFMSNGGAVQRTDPKMQQFMTEFRALVGAARHGTVPVAQVKALAEGLGVSWGYLQQTKVKKKFGLSSVGRGVQSEWTTELPE
jgi:RecA-family ATPase